MADPRTNTRWSDEASDRLEAMWNLGLSASEISTALAREKLGYWSRNAVIGRVTRMKMHGRERPSSPLKAAPRPKAVAQRAHYAGGAEGLARALERSRTPIEPKARKAPQERVVSHYIPTPQAPTPIRKVEAADIPATARPWLTRKFGECAFPVDGQGEQTRSCCGPVEDAGQYCTAHRARMYAASPTSKVRSYHPRRAA